MHLFCYCSSENELLDLLFPESSMSGNLGVNDLAHAVWSTHNFNHSLSLTGSLYFYLHTGIKLEDKKYRKMNTRYYVNSDSPVDTILLHSTANYIAYQSFLLWQYFWWLINLFLLNSAIPSMTGNGIFLSPLVFPVMYMTEGGLCCAKCFKCRDTC